MDQHPEYINAKSRYAFRHRHKGHQYSDDDDDEDEERDEEEEESADEPMEDVTAAGAANGMKRKLVEEEDYD